MPNANGDLRVAVGVFVPGHSTDGLKVRTRGRIEYNGSIKATPPPASLCKLLQGRQVGGFATRFQVAQRCLLAVLASHCIE